MKKILLLILIGLLAACESSALMQEEEVVVGPVVVEVTPVEILPEVVEENFDEETNQKVESEIEVVISEFLVTSYEELFYQIIQQSGLGNYEDFRYLGNQQYKLYFFGEIGIPTTVNYELRTNNKFVYMEVVEALGQLLDRYPGIQLMPITKIQINQGAGAVSILSNVLSVGYEFVLDNYLETTFTHRTVENYVIPFYTILEQETANWEKTIEEMSPISLRAINNTDEDLIETFYAYLLFSNKLLDNTNIDSIGYKERSALLEGLLENLDINLRLGDTPQNKPSHEMIDLNMGAFYDVITRETPSSLQSLDYGGIVDRFYEKLDMPDTCFHPNNCRAETTYYPSKLFSVHQFTATFPQNKSIEFNVTDNVNQEEAREIAEFFSQAYGRMPDVLLTYLDAVFIEAGVSNVWGGTYHGWGTTLRNCGLCDVTQWNQFEELILHELAHSSIDFRNQRYNHITGNIEFKETGLITLSEWQRRAENPDGNKLNQYSIDVPDEDIAESLLLYAAYRFYPDSVSNLTKDVIESLIPNRIRVFDEILQQ
jgi:hypothetical protein